MKMILAGATALVLVAVAGIASYGPGLSGPFLFDDTVNLSPLAQAGGEFSWHNLRGYLQSGWTGPTGRPISLTSFFLNAQNWPADPWVFKLTNLCLHLFNGLLGLGLAFGLLRLYGCRRAASFWAGLAGAALWLLHPIQVSSVLYVSQRMTILSALFTLLGLGGYVAGRAWARRRPGPGFLVMALCILSGTLLATFSKENGALVALYALVLEATLLARTPAPADRRWRTGRALLLVAPCVVLAAYFFRHWHYVVGAYSVHDFGLGERLLTQPRVLFDYLGMVVAPWTVDASLFHEDFLTSGGWLSPPATALAIAGLAALLAAALVLRRRMPVLAFAVLWFFVGHVLESSFLGLEMYNEYRNYLPLFGPALALAYGLMIAVRSYRVAGVAALGVCVLGAGALTHRAATAWGDAGALARYWEARSPGSWRVEQFVAKHRLEEKQPRRARDALRRAVEHDPGQIGVALQLTVVECLLGAASTLDRQALLQRARTGGYDSSVFTSLDALLQVVGNQRCRFPDLGELLAVERLLIANPRFSWAPQQARLRFDLALALMLGGRLPEAVQSGAGAMARGSRENVADTLAELFRRSGQSALALQYIEQARTGNAAHGKAYQRALDEIERAIKVRGKQ